MKTTAEILRAARAKIEKPECWTQRCGARDVYGAPVEARDVSAVCWCAYGAIEKAAGTPNTPEADDCLMRAIMDLGGRSVADFNDAPDRTHAEVLAAFDRAIALAEAA